MSRFHGTTLRLVRDMGPLSRTELMGEMGVSSPSLTKIANRLVEAGLLHEGGKRDEVNFGRPRQYLDLAETGWRVACVSLMPGRLEVGIADKDARVLLARRFDLDCSAIQALAMVPDALRALQAELDLGDDRIAGLCLTLPGHVDLEGRRLLAVSRPGWGEGPLIEVLEAALPWPVTLENKVTAMAFAEAVRARRADHHTMLYLYLDQGLGAAFIREGRGAAFSGRDALELGHIRVETPGRPCECGLSGCFETVLTADMIRSSDHEILGGAWPLVAQQFANIVNLLSPERVVLGGGLAQLSPEVRGSLGDAILAQVMPHARARTEFRPSLLGPDATLQGAAAVALDRFYYSGGTL
ncbi:ROK family transcriptional regulator [Paracoccus cavernae]|uniref:ROK family transcriptional regulator n=1 Tax=Paracoccus cavernae TaxID=1571207 RepID=UPI0035F34258